MASILKVRDADGTVHEIYSIQGKSAYQYAAEGGYTGTEEEFAAKMAAEIADEVDALVALAECGIITPAYQDGTFYTDVNGAIYIL